MTLTLEQIELSAASLPFEERIKLIEFLAGCTVRDDYREARDSSERLFTILSHLVEAIGDPPSEGESDGPCETIEQLRRHPAFIEAWQYLYP